jgi:hypothetical protein
LGFEPKLSYLLSTERYNNNSLYSKAKEQAYGVLVEEKRLLEKGDFLEQMSSLAYLKNKNYYTTGFENFK